MRGDPFKIQEGSVKDRRLHRFNAERNLGDNFLFLPDLKGWLGKNIKSHHFLYFFAFLLVIFIALSARIAYLQVWEAATFYSLAERNRIKTLPLRAPRGILYDRYERPLVENVSKFSFSVNPLLIQSGEQAILLRQKLDALVPDIREKVDAFFQEYQRKTQEEVLLEDVPYETALKLLIASSEFAALQVTSQPQRKYLYTSGFGGVLGHVGKISPAELAADQSYQLTDLIGKSGIERQYEAVLRGKDGSIQTEVDALGQEKSETGKTPPQKGSDLVLTIDLDAQKKMYEVLRRISSANRGLPAAGVIINPNDGELLALVSVPSYDSNIFTTSLSGERFTELQNDPLRPFFMRAIAGMYPAGSIFKLAVAAAALEQGIIDDSFALNSTGGILLGNRFFPDWRKDGHGITNVYHAIADSVNTFFYAIGGGNGTLSGLGVDAIVRYAHTFGFGSATGIDLPGEEPGFVPTRAWKEGRGERWYQGDTYNLSIGQGSLLVTPLQVARYTAVFANGGTVVQPHLLKAYRSSGTQQAYQKVATPATFVSRKTINIVRAGMRRTVTSGTAQRLQSVRVAVAGKTGTAQFSNTKSPHSWFSGFAPYEAPELVITVLVEEGGDANLATVAAQEFLEWYFARARS